MATYQPASRAVLLQFTVGSTWEIQKVYPGTNLDAYNLNHVVGEFFYSNRWVDVGGGHVVFDVQEFYRPIKAGFDTVFYKYDGWIYETADILVRNADGTGPSTAPPVVNDDHVTLDYSGTTGLLLTALMSNDVIAVNDKAIAHEIRSLTPSLTLSGAEGLQDAEYWAIPSDPNSGSFIGLAVLEYRVQDLLLQWSNWGKVYLEMLGNNQSKDDIKGNSWADTIDFALSTDSVAVHGLGGDDRISGGQAADNLSGDDGADLIGGKFGDDIINGGNGADRLYGDQGNDTIDGGADNDIIYGGEGNDTLRGGAGNDILGGDIGDDRLGGKTGNDSLRGGAGNDWIWGDEGNDGLYGDAGNDNLFGGDGNDFLTGGLGSDKLTGGVGVDTFIFIRGEASGDTVLDFQGAGVIGGDKLEFRGYGAGATLHHLTGDNWQIDGVGISETIKIAGVTNLSKADYHFV